eukprot:gene7208-5065_t
MTTAMLWQSASLPACDKVINYTYYYYYYIYIYIYIYSYIHSFTRNQSTLSESPVWPTPFLLALMASTAALQSYEDKQRHLTKRQRAAEEEAQKVIRRERLQMLSQKKRDSTLTESSPPNDGAPHEFPYSPAYVRWWRWAYDWVVYLALASSSIPGVTTSEATREKEGVDLICPHSPTLHLPLLYVSFYLPPICALHLLPILH